MGVPYSALSSSDNEPDDYPWLQIIQWATEGLSMEIVFTYDIPATKLAVNKFISDKKQFIFMADNASFDSELETIRGEVEGNDERRAAWEEWAESLLEEVPELSTLRFELVPAIMTETIFWRCFFSGAKRVILQDSIKGVYRLELDVQSDLH